MTEIDQELKTVAIIALQSPVIFACHEQWQQISELLSKRLDHPVVLLPAMNADECIDPFQSVVERYCEQGFRRFVIMPIGLESFDLRSLHCLILFARSLKRSVSIHVAKSWTLKDWADVLLPAVLDAAMNKYVPPSQSLSQQKHVILVVADGTNSEPDVGSELASLAYHFQQIDENLDVRYAFLANRKPSLSHLFRKMEFDRVQVTRLLFWRMDLNQIASAFKLIGSLYGVTLSPPLLGSAWTWSRMSLEQPSPIRLMEHTSWLHAAVGMYLDALASRSIERYFADGRSKNAGLHEGEPLEVYNSLIELDRRIDSMLPSEYQGKTDEVRMQSMGSASLKWDEFGKVAWDEIWTSFCDLALAGGPPHRGRLLEAITAEQAIANLSAYQSVVQEIRRGIEMVTGLQTFEAEVLGWVGILCEDEPMAVWLMRAIIVENVMVRREGAKLFLPAGPEFTVKREIKNVITSVAKTVHYWRAHLRTRLE